MDIERLKELKQQIKGVHDGINGDDLNLLYDLLPLVDEAIARQSVKSDSLTSAIDRIACWELENPIMGEDATIDLEEIPVSEARIILTALQAYQPWIPVSKRLPEKPEYDKDKGGYVLTRFSDRAIESWKWNEIASWNEDNGRSICKLAAITHWRPMLPEPPKGE